MIDKKLAAPPVFLTLGKGKPFVSAYGVSGASEHILEAYKTLWDIKAYGMAGLLGLSHRSSYYRYQSGERRPSPLLCLRLLQLELWFQAGVELHRAWVVDWESDPIVIYWANNTMSSPDPATGEWSAFPSPDSGVPAPSGLARLVLRQADESTERKSKQKRYVQSRSFKG